MVCNLHPTDCEDEMDMVENENPSADEEDIAPEQVLLGDVLTAGDNKDEEDVATIPHVSLLWNETHVSPLHPFAKTN